MLLSGNYPVKSVVRDWQCSRCKRAVRCDGFDDGLLSSCRIYLYCRSRLDALVSAITRFSMSGRAESGHRAEGARAALYGHDEGARAHRLSDEAGRRKETEAVALYMATSGDTPGNPGSSAACYRCEGGCAGRTGLKYIVVDGTVTGIFCDATGI